MNEIMKRMSAESPSFFKKIQAIGISLGAAGAAILVIPASVIVFPTAIITAAGYFVAVGAVAAAVAKSTVKDPAVLNPETPSEGMPGGNSVSPPSTPV